MSAASSQKFASIKNPLKADRSQKLGSMTQKNSNRGSPLRLYAKVNGGQPTNRNQLTTESIMSTNSRQLLNSQASLPAEREDRKS